MRVDEIISLFKLCSVSFTDFLSSSLTLSPAVKATSDILIQKRYMFYLPMKTMGRKRQPLTHGGLAPRVLLQLVLLYAVVGPLREGGNAGHRVRMCVRVRGRGVEMKIERAQQGGGRLAAGGGGAAVGDGGVGSLERSGVFKGRHRDGCSGPRLCCQGRQTNTSLTFLRLLLMTIRA